MEKIPFNINGNQAHKNWGVIKREVTSMKKILHNIVTGITQWGVKDSSISVASNDSSFSYIVKYSGGGKSSDYLPMLIALHGDGDTVDNFYETALNKINVRARIIVVKGPISHECGPVWPYSVAQFEEYGKAFSEAVDQFAINYPTISKPILLGFSGGGGMAYYQAVKHGDNYSYIFPISSLLAKEKLGDPSSSPDAKVFAYHGKNDEVIAFSEGKKTFKLLKRKKVNICFTEFESGHHGIYTDMKAKITQAVENKLNSL